MNWNLEHIENFTLREARCHGWEPNSRHPNRIWHDCGLVIIVPELCECVHTVRVRFKKPIIAKSWTRCPPHNLAVGGKDDSYHKNGHAIDMAPLNLSDLDELVAIAQEFPFTYRAPWGLHGDIRGERPAFDVITEDRLLKRFRVKYGTLMGLKLVVFYSDWKRGGEVAARAGVQERTFYHYRKILYKDGFLTDDDIKSGGNARWIK